MDCATCGPIACALCPATTSFTILVSECDIEGNVVVVEGASVVVVGAIVVVVTGGLFNPTAKAIPTPTRMTTSTIAVIIRALRTLFLFFEVVRATIGAASGATMEVSPSCPFRDLPGSPTIVVRSLDATERTQGDRNVGVASIVDTSRALSRSSGVGASIPVKSSFQGTGRSSGNLTGPAIRRASTSLGVPA